MDEVRKFFSNTLDRHGGGQRPDVQDPVPVSGGYESCATLLVPGTELQEETSNRDSGSVCATDTIGEGSWSQEVIHGGNVNAKVSGKYDHVGGIMNESPRGRSFQMEPLSVYLGVDGLANAIGVSDYRLSGDANDLASPRIEGLTISHDAHKSSPSSFEEGVSPLGHQSHRASHLYFSRPIMENGELKDEDTNKCTPENSDVMEKKSSYQHLQLSTEATGSSVQGKQDENHVNNDDEVTNQSETKQCSPSNLASFSSEDFYPGSRGYWFPTGNVGPPEAFNALSDLNGDYDSHFNSLQVGRWYYDYALNAALSPIPPPLPSQYPSKNAWDIIRRSVQVKQNAFGQISSNGLLARPSYYPIRPPILPGGATLGMEEMPKPRGTGTYFPNMVFPSY